MPASSMMTHAVTAGARRPSTSGASGTFPMGPPDPRAGGGHRGGGELDLHFGKMADAFHDFVAPQDDSEDEEAEGSLDKDGPSANGYETSQSDLGSVHFIMCVIRLQRAFRLQRFVYKKFGYAALRSAPR